MKIGNLGNHSKAKFLEINEQNDNNNDNNKLGFRKLEIELRDWKFKELFRDRILNK